MISAMEKATGLKVCILPYNLLKLTIINKIVFKIPYKFCARREGDIASCFADSSLAQKELGWKATKNVDDMCKKFYE